MKTCFKCGLLKPLDEFYKHPKMADGHLGKCKYCTKSDSANQHKKIMSTPSLTIKERERGRVKSRLQRIAGLASPQKPETGKRWGENHPNKKKAHALVASAVRSGKLIKMPCEKCGSENTQAHHEDYDKPLCVNWLCVRHHADRHIEINQENLLQKFNSEAR